MRKKKYVSSSFETSYSERGKSMKNCLVIVIFPEESLLRYPPTHVWLECATRLKNSECKKREKNLKNIKAGPL